MNPYLMLTRDPRTYDRMTGKISHTVRGNASFHDRSSLHPSPVSVSEMISVGALRTVNAVQRGWGRMASFIGG